MGSEERICLNEKFYAKRNNVPNKMALVLFDLNASLSFFFCSLQPNRRIGQFFFFSFNKSKLIIHRVTKKKLTNKYSIKARKDFPLHTGYYIACCIVLLFFSSRTRSDPSSWPSFIFLAELPSVY